MLLFEVCSEDTYEYTAYMIVDNNGKIEVDIQKIDYPFRLNRADMAVKRGKDILIVCGEEGSKIATYTIETD